MNALYRLGNRRTGTQAWSCEIELAGSQVVETVALVHFQVPVLCSKSVLCRVYTKRMHTRSTYNVPARVPVSRVHSLAFCDDLFHLASTLLDSSLITSTQELVWAILVARQRHGIERQNCKSLGEPLGCEMPPDLVDTALRTRLSLLFLLLAIIIVGIVLI